ncbi:MAG: hypothetical protein N2595_09150 [bacterium]|nr:hypothetical protein [bacterium]
MDDDCGRGAGGGTVVVETNGAERVGDDGERELYVPMNAVVSNGGGVSVWVIEGGRARLQSVRIEGCDDGRVRVVEGLRAGQRVVVDPPVFLANGRRVEAE